MNRNDVIRQAILIAVLSTNAWLSEYACGTTDGKSRGYTDVVSTVRAGSIAVLWASIYLIIASLWCGRPHTKELPKLTMQTIWAHVYGLGLLVFVTIYCLLGVSSGCTAAYFMALAGISLDDVLARHRETYTRRASMLICAILGMSTGVLASYKAPDFDRLADAVDTGNWFVIVCGGVLPLASPFLFNFIRGQRRYAPMTVLEFIHFAMPFAAILSVVVLCTLSVIPQQLPPQQESQQPPFFATEAEANWSRAHMTNRSTESAMVDRIMLVTASDIALPLLPFTMLPALFMTVQTVLLYSTADFLSAASLVIAVKYFYHSPSRDAHPFIPCITAGLAFAFRVYAACNDKDAAATSIYSAEMDEDGDTIETHVLKMPTALLECETESA